MQYIAFHVSTRVRARKGEKLAPLQGKRIGWCQKNNNNRQWEATMTRLAALILGLSLLLMSPNANAQGLQFQLGLSDGMILNVMGRNGYSDVRITKKKLTKAQAEGCRNGKRYKVEISLDGRIRKEVQIGTCRAAINQQIARNILRKKGYKQIVMRPEGNHFSAVACRGNKRFRVSMNLYGEIQGEIHLGRCAGNLSNHDVAALLRAQGFSRLTVKRGPRGNYAAEGCRGDDKLGLVVGRNGAIIRQQRIGRCDPAIHPSAIPSLLARYGFSRVEVIDSRLPRYLAHACRGNERLEVAMNRFGEISDERRVGRCDPPLTGPALEKRLRDAGFTGVKILAQRANGFTAEVCEDAALLRLELTIFGETIRQSPVGQCPTRPIGDVLGEFERQGFSGTTVFIEGCRRGRRVRVELDRTGDEINRKVLGRCR